MYIVMGSDSQPLFPGLVVAQYGKGKVAYLPAALDAMYRQTRIRQFSDVQLFVPVEFSHRVEEDILSVTIPKVDNYQGVMIELE